MTRILVGVGFVLAVATSAAAECTQLSYHVGRNYIEPNGWKGLIQVSLRPGDITVDNLVCMADGFRTHHPEWADIMLLFFSSEEAADNWQPGYGDSDVLLPTEKWDSEMRAAYILDVTNPEEHLDIMPLGWNDGADEYNTRIDLPNATTPPHCRLEIKDRCLLAFTLPAYPDAWKRSVSGAVTFSGRIGRDGKMAGIRVAEAESTPPDAQTFLIREALANLKTWQLEPRLSEDTFEITYSYVIDPSGRAEQPEVQLALPDRITISASPHKD